MTTIRRVEGPASANGQELHALAGGALQGTECSIAGQDDRGSWKVQMRLAKRGRLLIRFEMANNVAVWGNGLEDIDGNLTLWGEFETSKPPDAVVGTLLLVESEAHRLAMQVGEA